MADFWAGTPKWIRWSFLVSLLGFVILLSNAKKAFEELHDWVPVTYGGLEAWAAPKLDETKQLAVNLATQLDAKFTDRDWNTIIYRSKDLRFQIESLKGQEYMLQLRLQAEPGNELAMRRLDEVRDQIKLLEDELEALTCQIEARGQPALIAKC